MVERRPVTRHDKMVCFDDGADRFQMRAAAIATRNGRVLVQNIKGEATVFLPGGRVEQGESSGDTLVREMEEEFGHVVEVGDLVYVMESFYPSRGQHFHELSLYYKITVGEDFPYHDSEICHRCFEGTAEMEYRWVPLNEAALDAVRFHPKGLRARLADLPTRTEHIVTREDE
jgi:8-oxo-dGTP pyrophosphatase MutT (NUDIX family)